MKRLLLVAWCGVGCGLAAPSQGDVVAPGVARAKFEVRMHHTDRVPVDVVYPSDADGFPQGSSLPGFVLIQGGAVAASRYFWLAEALAMRGYVTALPQHPADLAIFAIDEGRFARELLVAPPLSSLLSGLVDPQHIAVGGHSLGGVVSTKLALGDGFTGLVLLASYPDGVDVNALPSLDMPSLSVAAPEDCSAPLEEVEAGAAQLPSPTALVKLAGLSHYGFTDSLTEDESRGCAPALSLEEGHARIADAVGIFLDDARTSGGTGAAQLALIPGAEVVAR